MNKKTLLILMFGIFLISFISPLDEQLPYCQGGDSELIVCIGDEELIFLSGIGLPEDYGSGGGAGAEYITIKEEIPEEIEPEEPPVEEVVKEWLKKWWWVIFLLCLIIFFMCRKKKCEGCKKRFKKKYMKKYKGKFYCKNCYEKVNIELIELRKNYNAS